MTTGALPSPAVDADSTAASRTAGLEGSNEASVRVASVPADHPYVHGIGAADDGVVRLDDPIPDAAHPTRWWPPAMLDGRWIATHADDFDVMHVHFGTESLPDGRLEAALQALRAANRPLVVTVHDLQNPQLHDQARHARDLDLLVAHATELITLTQGVAAEIRRRWGRDATVVAHPAVLADEVEVPIGHPTGAFLVGVHLRDVRPSIDAEASVATLVDALVELRRRGIPAAGRVFVNDRVRDPEVLDLLRARLAGRVDVELRVRPRASDAELAEEIADLDVTMLPYRHGTHSGWVELCHDLGVPVVGPGVGWMAEQHPSEHETFRLGDGPSLADAVAASIVRHVRPGTAERAALVAERRAERRRDHADIVRAHAAAYQRALGREVAR